MVNINIAKVLNKDIYQLQQISRQTFAETFAAYNTAANMHKYLEERFSAKILIDEINNENSEFYFAYHNTHIVGYLKLNFGQAQTELRDANAIEIERIYVLKEYHGKGIGQLLYERVLQIAVQKGIKYIWLGVWEKNKRAIGFYKKNNFVEFDKHIFILGNDKQTDIMMKYQLE